MNDRGNGCFTNFKPLRGFACLAVMVVTNIEPLHGCNLDDRNKH
jgi:hypothetical protein